MNAVTADICRRHVEFEVQALVLRHVCAGTISTDEAGIAANAAIPIVAKAAKHLRMNGRSVAEVAEIFAAKRAQATTPAARFAAELYCAIWTGMQTGFREMHPGREL